jgi:hypothetical protein
MRMPWIWIYDLQHLKWAPPLLIVRLRLKASSNGTEHEICYLFPDLDPLADTTGSQEILNFCGKALADLTALFDHIVPKCSFSDFRSVNLPTPSREYVHTPNYSSAD